MKSSPACKVCGEATQFMGSVDFNQNCEMARGKTVPRSGLPVRYHQCPACGFLFTADFDGWSRQEFLDRIYNDAYVDFDPDYAEVRPRHNAALVDVLVKQRRGLKVLDYGAGNGELVRQLFGLGYQALGYDPLTSETMPAGPFDLVTCFEVLEHCPNPWQAMTTMGGCVVAPDGLVLFSTMVTGWEFARQGLDWWYVAPRNGHVSIFSREALRIAWRTAGFQCASFNDNLHVAYRELPDWARHWAEPRNTHPGFAP